MPNHLIPGENSIKNLEHVKKVIAKPNYGGLFGISIEEGRGNYLYDVDGNEYLDCLSAASTNIIGYGNEKVVSAYQSAAIKMQHSAFIYSPNQHALNLADKLIEIAPGDFNKKVMLGLTGSDGCDGVIKAMRAFTGIMGIVHFKNDYHGSTGLSMPASDFSSLNDDLFKKNKFFRELHFPKNEEEAVLVLKKIKKWLKKKKIGGILTESIQGDAGINIAPKGFFIALKKLTEKYNGVLAVDEVQSGMGRTGKWWAIEHEGIAPDLIISAKGLSGGYAPISAVIGREDILDALGNSQHVFTYSGHAPCTAAALAVINEVQSLGLVKANEENGAELLDFFRKLQKNNKNLIVDARGRGLMLGVEISIADNPLLGKVFATRCVEKGLYVGFFGVNGEVVRVEPPFTLSKTEINIVKSVFLEVVKEFQEGKVPKVTYENVNKYSVGL